MNHLSSEKSPYLLQHVHNPVDWYPWSDAAFEKARHEDKPIFLSVGYSTCHWCHVMERESFENEEIAAVLNRFFVPIKVDREERPDVDRIYMTFVQATTGSGGWPMSVFLTPELKPFFGGTYFPPDNRYGRPGFRSLLEHLGRAWANERDRILESGNDVLAQLERHAGARPERPGNLDPGILDASFHYFRRTFDSRQGGFGEAPKFPRPVVLNFLLRYHRRAQNEEALEMTLATLRAMARGGMHDQLGGGFHRYSVDERWFVPHFEKMLYDQAQLAVSYLEAYQITRDEYFAAIARDIFEYVLRDMTHPGGGFYSAEDADSIIDPAHPKEKGEGAFYIWSRQEIDSILGSPAAEIFSRHYGVEAHGNVDHDPQNEFTGKNILYVRQPAADAATESVLREAAAKLLEERNRRVRPHLDDKVLTAWNGLMISALAKGAQILDEPRYLEASRRAANFILTRMFDAQTARLLRRFRDEDAAIPGFLDDYAFFTQGLIDLYEAGFELDNLDTALAITRRMVEDFEDRENGAFFSTAAGDQSLLLRMKDDYDGAEPSGNSVALLNLLRLAQFTNQDDMTQAADRAFRGLTPRLVSQPVATPQILVAYMFALAPKRQIVLAGDREAARPFLRERNRRFLPDSITLLIDSPETSRRLASYIPAVEAMQPLHGEAAAYVCENYACQLPATGVARFVELLQ